MTGTAFKRSEIDKISRLDNEFQQKKRFLGKSMMLG